MHNQTALQRFALLFHPLLPLAAALLALAACSDGNSGPPKPQPDNPVVEGPVTGGGGPDCCKLVYGGLEFDISTITQYTPGTPFYAGLYFDEAELGYRETEYFISGTATSYIATDDLGEDGVWSIQPADAAPYKSRIVVLRPERAKDFNGSVLVEWLNVSGGTDAAPDLVQMHVEMMRRGYAWVGVSAQSVGVEGGGIFEGGLKSIDPTRYGGLSHPGDSFSYDIYSQAAQAVRRPAGLDPLDGLKVKYMIGVGESQSASRLATYVNAVHPTIRLFDGFLIHSRGSGAAPLSQSPQAVVSPPRPTFIRGDFRQPVLSFETEGDVFGLGSAATAQPDADNFRLWEVAGNAHYDVYGIQKGPLDRGDDPGVAEIIETSDAAASGLIECDRPINDGPGTWVLRAALSSLDKWIRTNIPAASAQPLVRSADGTALERDHYGNAIGGVRTPHVDAPVATLSSLGQSGTSFCFLFGTTELFDRATLSALYPTREAYVQAIDASTDSAVDKGFLLPEDAELIKEQARLSGKFSD